MSPTATRRAGAVSAILGTAALVAACGSATQNPGPSASAPASAPASASAAPTTAAPTTTAPSASPTGAAASSCAPGQLKATVSTSQGSGTAGSIYYPLTFTNRSSSTCTMYGYPGVSFVTGVSGSQIGQPAARNPSVAATTVTLAPGGKAHATLQVAEAGNYTPSQCRPVTAHWLKTYPPGQYGAIYTRFTTQVCSGKLPSKIGRQVSVSVVQPGPGKSGQTS